MPSLPVALSDCACVLSSRLPCQEIASPCTHPWPLTSPTPSHTPPPHTPLGLACMQGVLYTHRSNFLHSMVMTQPDALNLSAASTVLMVGWVAQGRGTLLTQVCLPSTVV